MAENMLGLTIGKAAKEAGISVEALRFYERRGLIPEPARNHAGYRQYLPETIKRLHFIRRAKEVGFTLKDIEELLQISANPDSACLDIKRRAQRKIEEADRKIQDLQKIRDALESLTRDCETSANTSECPLLAALDLK